MCNEVLTSLYEESQALSSSVSERLRDLFLLVLFTLSSDKLKYITNKQQDQNIL